MDLSPVFEPGIKDASAGRVIHDLAQALEFGRVRSVQIPKDARDSVRAVVESFNKFVNAGEDPFKFPGFARMRFSDMDIESAEPLIREMLLRGHGVAFVEAGSISCDRLAKTLKKRRFSPRRVLASSNCLTCMYNSGGRCSKLKMRVSNTADVTSDDVKIEFERAKESVPSEVLRGIVGKTDSRREVFAELVQARRFYAGYPMAESNGLLSMEEKRNVLVAASLKEADVSDMFYTGDEVEVGENVTIHEFKLKVAESTEVDLESSGSSLDDELGKIISSGKSSELELVEL